MPLIHCSLATQNHSKKNQGNIPLLALIAALAVATAGCAVGQSALPLLPPAPIRSSGTFAIANNFGPCPAGSTPSNPGAASCTIISGANTVDVLPDAFLGGTYTATVTTTGGTVPVTSCQIQGTIPTGITLSATPSGNTCVITGTFAASVGLTIPPGGFVAIPLTVRATDSSNPAAVDVQDVVIRIFAGFTFTTATIENGTQGRAFNKTIASNLAAGSIGVPPMTACSMTGAPAGLSIAPSGNNCVITGTPSVNGTFTVTVTGTDSGANTRSSAPYTLIINPPLTVSAPAFTNGTQGRTYIALTVNTAGGQRPLTACTATGLPAGMTIATNPANTATNVNSCIISGTPTASGAFNVVVSATDTATPTTAAGTSNSASTPLTINPPLAVTPFTLDNGTQGRAFNFTVATTGGQTPLTGCTATGLPGGLAIAVSPPSNCAITGTPTVSGAFSVVVTVTDTATANTAAGSDTSASTPLTVNPPLAVPAFTLQTGAEGAVFSATVPTAGGNRPLTACSATGLASGLAIALDPANTATNVNNCLITGTPAGGSAGNYNVVVTVTDTASTTTAAGNASSASTPQTINPPLAIPAFVLGNGTEARAFQQDIPVTGGLPPITACAISAGALPAGLAISVSPVPNNCRISGTPAGGTAGAFNITVQATDTGAPPNTAPATATSAATPLTINPPLVISTVANTLLDAVTGRAGYSLTFTNTGGQTTFSWSSTGLGAGACSGMSLSAAGVFSGTPTTAGTCNFSASVTDTATTSTAAGTTTGSFTLTVRPEFTVTQASFADGVESRTYGNAPQIQPVTTDVLAVAGGSDFGQAENGNGPLTACAVTSVVVSSGAPGTPLTTANFTALVDATANQCRLQSVGAFPAGSAAVYRVDVSATDNPIAGVGVPAGTRSTSLLLTVQPALTLTLNPDPLPDAVSGRNYGVGAGCSGGACLAPTYTASGGIGAYTFGGGGTYPAGFVCTAAATTFTCTATPVTAGAGAVATAVTVSDAGNTAVPSGNAAVNRNITVQAALTSAPNPAVNPPPAAVQGRTYGGPGFTPLTYTAAGGLGGFTFAAITPIPLPGTGVPINVACTPAAAVLTCSSGAANVTAAPGAYNFSVDVSDTANASVASGSAPTIAQTINVNAPLSLAVNQADPLNTAVRLRSYGVGATCGLLNSSPCQDVNYTASGGLGGYAFTPAGYPAGFVCTPAGNILSCTAASVTDVAGPYTPSVTLNDTANATTPSGSGSATTFVANNSLTVVAELSFGINLTAAGPPASFTTGGLFGNNPVTVPDGVDLRSYGPSAFDGTKSPLEYTVAGGLAPYGFAPNGVFPSTTAGAGVFCNGSILSGPTQIGIRCDTTNGGVVPTGVFPAGTSGAPGPNYVYDFTANDTANNSVPRVSININTTLVVRPALAQTLNPASPFPTGVNNRRYGSGAGCSGGACVPITYTVTVGTGLAPYAFTNTGGFLGAPGAGYPTGFACTAAGNVFTCSAAVAVTGTSGTYTPSVNINDTGNATTPSNQAVSPLDVAGSLTVVDDIAINTPAFGDGTVSRAFGTGTGVGPQPPNVDLTVTGGLTGKACTGPTPAFGLTATFQTLVAPPAEVCRITGSPSPAGPASLTVTVNDTANVSAPSNSDTSGAIAFTINDTLAITTAALPGGITTQAYAASVAVTGGETPYFWFIIPGVDFDAPVGGIQAGVTGTACEGLSFDTATGAFSGMPVNPGTCGPFTVQVNDTATTTTGSALATVGAPTVNLAIVVVTPITIAPWTSTEENGTVNLLFGSGSGGPVDYAVAGGSGTFTCSTVPALPTGMTIAVSGTNCRISGTPTVTAAATAYQVRATDTVSLQVVSTTTAAFAIQPSLQLNGGVTALANAVATQAYSLLITSSGGTPPRTITNPSGDGATTLDTGDADCSGLAFGITPDTITGTAGPASTCTFTLQVDQTTTTTTAGNSGAITFTIVINPMMSITTTQANIINGLVGATYPGITFTATGGVGTPAWFDSADTEPAGCNGGALTALPGGLALDGLGVLSGTPTTASTAPPGTSFQVCVQDPGNAAVTAYEVFASFDLAVMSRLIYVADPANDQVNVVNSATNTEVDTVAGAGTDPIALTAGDNPEDVVVSPNGRRVFVTANGADVVRVIDTISHAVIDTVTLGTCTGPRGIAAERVGTTDRVYVACTNGQAATFDANAAVPIGAATAFALTGAGVLDSVAFRSNAAHDRAYFTDNTNNRIYAVDTTGAGTTEIDLNGLAAGTHFAMSTGTGFGSSPRGIIVVPNGANQYAYVAMSADDGATNDNFAHILDVDTDTLAEVLTGGTTMTLVSTTNNATLQYMAHDPANDVVYITQNGTGTVRQLNNAVSPPVRSTTGVETTPPDAPVGVTVPPISGRVYVGSNSTGNLDHFGLSAFNSALGAGGQIALAGAATPTPRRVNHISVPR